VEEDNGNELTIDLFSKKRDTIECNCAIMWGHYVLVVTYFMIDLNFCIFRRFTTYTCSYTK
jgi:hypothetical protein